MVLNSILLLMYFTPETHFIIEYTKTKNEAFFSFFWEILNFPCSISYKFLKIVLRSKEIQTFKAFLKIEKNIAICSEFLEMSDNK